MYPKALPADLPTSLDSRIKPAEFQMSQETEMYDAWQGVLLFTDGSRSYLQFFYLKCLSTCRFCLLIHFCGLGQSQILTTPIPTRLNFALDTNDSDEDDTEHIAQSESRLESMLAAQTALRQDEWTLQDETSIAKSKNLSDAKKGELLQKALTMAASNGDVDKITKLLEGEFKKYVDMNMADEEGTNPLIYAACFVSWGLTYFSWFFFL